MQGHPLAHNTVFCENPAAQAVEVFSVDIGTSGTNKRMNDTCRDHIIFRLCHQDVVASVIEFVVKQCAIKHIFVNMREILARCREHTAGQFYRVDFYTVLCYRV